MFGGKSGEVAGKGGGAGEVFFHRSRGRGEESVTIHPAVSGSGLVRQPLRGTIPRRPSSATAWASRTGPSGISTRPWSSTRRRLRAESPLCARRGPKGWSYKLKYCRSAFVRFFLPPLQLLFPRVCCLLISVLPSVLAFVQPPKAGLQVLSRTALLGIRIKVLGVNQGHPARKSSVLRFSQMDAEAFCKRTILLECCSRLFF